LLSLSYQLHAVVTHLLSFDDACNDVTVRTVGCCGCCLNKICISLLLLLLLLLPPRELFQKKGTCYNNRLRLKVLTPKTPADYPAIMQHIYQYGSVATRFMVRDRSSICLSSLLVVECRRLKSIRLYLNNLTAQHTIDGNNHIVTYMNTFFCFHHVNVLHGGSLIPYCLIRATTQSSISLYYNYCC
jgi:hypothetical protein